MGTGLEEGWGWESQASCSFLTLLCPEAMLDTEQELYRYQQTGLSITDQPPAPPTPAFHITLCPSSLMMEKGFRNCSSPSARTPQATSLNCLWYLTGPSKAGLSLVPHPLLGPGRLSTRHTHPPSSSILATPPTSINLTTFTWSSFFRMAISWYTRSRGSSCLAGPPWAA